MRGVRQLGIVSAGVLSATLLAQSGSPQPQQPTFRSGVDLIDVDVSIIDKDRRPVPGLTADDFTVLEDGKPRPIVAFTPVDLPPRELPSASWMEAIAPDIATNRHPPEGRLIVLMMDRFIANDQRPIARDIAEAAILQLRQGDLAAVVFATHGMPQNFTSDRALLLSAVNRPFATLPDGDAGAAGGCYCGSCSLETIAHVAESMGEVRQRRKILIIVGSNISISPMGTCSGVLNGVRDRAIRALKAGNITVHAFDPAGLDVPTQGAISKEPPNYLQLRAASMRRRGNIGVLPGETGGRVVGSNEPAAEVGSVFRETASYYVLGVHPAATKPDGRFHSIEVKVSRPDVTLQARQGYYAGARKTEPKSALKKIPPVLAGAVAGVWPRTDLALRMQAIPFALPGLRDAELQVLVSARVEDVPHVDTAQGSPTVAASAVSDQRRLVDVFLGAFDRNGKSLADTKQTLSLPVRPATDGSAEVEYEIPLKLKVKPGRYEVRAAVAEQATGRSGSVYGYVEVPDYTQTPVALSGILVEATPDIEPVSQESRPFVATTRREFGTNERVTAVIREYQGLTRPLMPGYLHVQVLNARDQRVFGHEMRLLPDQFGANRAVDHGVQIPIRDFERGEYLLTMEVRHGNTEVRREMRFAVR
jgi:VWFA-related protein